ncbi:MAG: ABC transporter permease [Bacteroidia bacterium]|nr:ABC transporter permease [Bacteroidia bacterium]MCX7652112.1 ABC transporter permease [Bacteroidia bacterium]MDW8417502.1 ABC transporter permease [Bacteroidia bacterium]
MLKFSVGLFLRSVAILFISFTLIFLIIRGLGDPTHMLLGQRADQTSLEMIRAQLHLDEPLWKQYLLSWADWLPYRKGEWRTPSLGLSYQYGRSVWDLYAERFPATLLLGSLAMTLAGIMGVTLGLWHSLYPSVLMRSFALFLIALPGYVVGIFLIWLFALKLRSWTGLSPSGYIATYDPVCECIIYRWKMVILPAVALALRPAAYLFLLTSEQAKAILNADYIRTARAKGKPLYRTLCQDVLRNLLPSLFISISQWLAGILTGAIFIEELFDWPGVGKLLFSAVMSSDFPLLVGIAQLSTLIFIILHAFSEVLSRWSDPRLRT